MASETDSTTKGYHLDEQTFTHIVAAHLDTVADYTVVEQTSETTVSIITEGFVTTVLPVRDKVTYLYSDWKPSVYAKSDSVVVEFDYDFKTTDRGCERFNEVKERTADLLAVLLRCETDGIDTDLMPPDSVEFPSTATWQPKVDLKSNLTRPILDRFHETGLYICGLHMMDVGDLAWCRASIKSDTMY